MKDDVEVARTRGGMIVRWRGHNRVDTGEIEHELAVAAPGYEVDWGTTVMNDAGDFAAKLRKTYGRAVLSDGPKYYGIRVVPSHRAGYAPGKYVVQYKDANGMWFDIGDPKSKVDADARAKAARKRVAR